MDLEKENFLITLQFRLNNSYVDYDKYLKKYINVTSYSFTEDMMFKPFKRRNENY